MTQHFLHSAQARTLSVAKVARMSDEEARGVFRKIRWAETDGKAVCPHCGSDDGREFYVENEIHLWEQIDGDGE